MVVLWGLLNIFSDMNWDDEKLKVFGIALAISLLGGLAITGIAAVVPASFDTIVTLLLALGAYFVIGWGLLMVLAGLTLGRGAAAMGIFVAIKFAVTFGLAAMTN